MQVAYREQQQHQQQQLQLDSKMLLQQHHSPHRLQQVQSQPQQQQQQQQHVLESKTTTTSSSSELEELSSSSQQPLRQVTEFDVTLGCTHKGTIGLQVWRVIRGERHTVKEHEVLALVKDHYDELKKRLIVVLQQQQDVGGRGGGEHVAIIGSTSTTSRSCSQLHSSNVDDDEIPMPWPVFLKEATERSASHRWDKKNIDGSVKTTYWRRASTLDIQKDVSSKRANTAPPSLESLSYNYLVDAWKCRDMMQCENQPIPQEPTRKIIPYDEKKVVTPFDVPLGYTRTVPGLVLWREARGPRRRPSDEETVALMEKHKQLLCDCLRQEGYLFSELPTPVFLVREDCKEYATYRWGEHDHRSDESFWREATLGEIQRDVNNKRGKQAPRATGRLFKPGVVEKLLAIGSNQQYQPNNRNQQQRHHHHHPSGPVNLGKPRQCDEKYMHTPERDAVMYVRPDVQTIKSSLERMAPSPMQLVVPTSHDVIIPSFHDGSDVLRRHPGNVKLTALARSRAEEYFKMKHLPTKAAIARIIVRQIRNAVPAGRFLSQNDDGTWQLADDETALEMVNSTLRQLARQLNIGVMPALPEAIILPCVASNSDFGDGITEIMSLDSGRFSQFGSTTGKFHSFRECADAKFMSRNISPLRAISPQQRRTISPQRRIQRAPSGGSSDFSTSPERIFGRRFHMMPSGENRSMISSVSSDGYRNMFNASSHSNKDSRRAVLMEELRQRTVHNMDLDVANMTISAATMSIANDSVTMLDGASVATASDFGGYSMQPGITPAGFTDEEWMNFQFELDSVLTNKSGNASFSCYGQEML